MKTQIPDLTAANDEDLASTHDSLVEEFDSLHDAGSTDVALLTEIADAIDAVRAEINGRQEAVAQAEAAVAALAERIRPAVEDTVAEVDPEEGDDSEDNDDEAEAQQEEKVLVTASANVPAKAPSARATRRFSPAPEAPKAAQPEVVITAAADVPGYAGGANLDTTGLAKALHAKARTLSNGSGYVPVAAINLPIPAENKLGADLAFNLDVIERVTAPSALTASGWCAPSQNLYDLFGIDAGDGLLDLPTVQVTRGGLNVPGFIGLGEASGALWTWTEDSAGNEETKQCLYIPCPDFTDYRLEAEGLCLTAGNLTDRAFPELTRRFVSLAINAHLHRVSAAMINKIVGSATGVSMSAYPTSAAGSILNAIDLQVADYRSQYRMSVNSVLEVIFPLWTKELLRSDLAMRQGPEGYTNVSDDQINAHFATRKVRAQFVHDYQPLYGMGAATAWPTSLDFLIYPAGGYIKGDGGTIDLGVVRDSVLNATNDYTAAWTEQLYLVAQVGPDAREVTVDYAVDGVTGCCPTAPVA